MADVLTPEQISQILQGYFDVIANREYIGGKVCPTFGRRGETSIEWDNDAPYEPLTVVLYEGDSYTSRQYVPTGVEITNTDFWVKTGDYNAEIAELDATLAGFSSDNTVASALSRVSSSLPFGDDGFNPSNTAKDYMDDVSLATCHVFETVADMQAATDLVSGMIAHTNGFHASGDGGAAFYEINDSGIANGMDVLTLQNSLYATLTKEATMTPEQFGAYGDGTHDDTTALQRCVTISRSVVLNKTYLVSITENHGSCVVVPSNTSIQFNGATVTMAGTTYAAYQVFYINDVSNVKIYGVGNIIGDRTLHDSTSGEWGVVIAIVGATNATVDGLTISNGFGDGVYVHSSIDVSIKNCTVKNNRRNNISVISCDGCYIGNCILDYPHGTNPQSNIGVEANTSDDVIKGVLIENCVCTNTAANEAIYITTRSDHNDVTVKDCKLDKALATTVLSGDYNTFDISGCEITNVGNDSGAININNTPTNTHVTYDNCTFIGGVAIVRHTGTALHNLCVKNCRLKDATYSRPFLWLGSTDTTNISGNYIHVFMEPDEVVFSAYTTNFVVGNTNDILIVESTRAYTLTTQIASALFPYYVIDEVPSQRPIEMRDARDVPLGQVKRVMNRTNSSVNLGISTGAYNVDTQASGQLIVIPAGKYVDMWNVNNAVYYKIV